MKGGHHEQVGTLAQEAGLLLDLVLQRLQDSTRDAAGTTCTECGRTPGARCSTGCPLCAVLAVVRGEPADIPAPVVQSVTTALGAVRGWLAGTTGQGPDSDGDPATAQVRDPDRDVPSDPVSAAPPTTQPPTTLQRIDISP